MKLHEYQSKKLFKKYNIPVPNGFVLRSLKNINKKADKIKKYPVVVKAQVHTGGRGKAGGVKLAKNKTEVFKYSKDILGMNLVTHQTGSAGIEVKKILIEEGAEIKKEYYLSILVDRAVKKIVILGSSEGGMEIEEIAATKPEKIISVKIDPVIGLRNFNIYKLIKELKIPAESVREFSSIVKKLYSLFIHTDASLVEINPLVILKSNRVIALDAKVGIDDNALYRHPELEKLRDKNEEDPLEYLARIKKVNYVRLDGNIGCMVNGAGLAMCTMDVIKLYGEEPANFLDIGGGAKAEQVTEALKIITMDKNVKGILINIFGGIVRCDEVARGFVKAIKQLKLKLPIAIRLTGTNDTEGKKILMDAGYKAYDTMADAAKDIVKVVRN